MIIKGNQTESDIIKKFPKRIGLTLIVMLVLVLTGCSNKSMNYDIENETENKESDTVSVTDNEEFPNWGLSLSVENVTPTGLTLVCTQSGGALTGELNTGSYYNLIVLKDGIWSDVPTVIEDYGWTMEGYTVPKGENLVFDVRWEWIYGKLPAGTYRLTKDFWDFRESGDFDNFTYWTEFEIK